MILIKCTVQNLLFRLNIPKNNYMVSKSSSKSWHTNDMRNFVGAVNYRFISDFTPAGQKSLLYTMYE